MHALPDDATEAIEPGDDVLVLCPSAAGDEAACADVSTLDDPGGTELLSVTVGGPPRDRLDALDRYVDTEPARTAVVAVDADTRSAACATTDDECAGAASRRDSVSTVSSVEDLTELGAAIAEQLAEWQETERRTALCFDSLTTLVQCVPTERAFKFLYVLSEHPAVDDATAHYHFDPTVHDRVTIATLAELFDVVCERERTWSVDADPSPSRLADSGVENAGSGSAIDPDHDSAVTVGFSPDSNAADGSQAPPDERTAQSASNDHTGPDSEVGTLAGQYDRVSKGVGPIPSVVPGMRHGAPKRNLVVAIGYLLLSWVVGARVVPLF